MSEKLFKFLLSELKTVRFRCVKCGTVTEMDIDKAEVRLQDPRCPVCKEAWGTVDPNHFVNFAAAVRGIRGRTDVVEVEFVLPDAG